MQRLAIAPSQFQNQQIILTAEQQHYLSRVLRLREGDRFIAMDGLGHWWLAKLEGNQAQILEPILQPNTELPVAITLMAALPKGNGFDEVVRYSTEVGVVAIVPLVSDRTLLNPSTGKLERWRRIAIEAAEQSERQIVPTILDPVPFATALSLAKDKNYICVARGDSPHLRDCLQNKDFAGSGDSPNPESRIPNPQHPSIAIAIGPEGGWTAAETEKAIASGFQPVSLGRRILRAVTAPLVALSLVAAAFED
ncbi:16S rRNA (uracil(1498)-N(3))-methyltransferase [Funiculus sociatus GB2-A5]|uniref:Ribosomal RNA small subunit methyltransferase E n=1 Tax=Funiculus sociatus GB2-A5 TaxID=2933946 RepID=A0ABV0JJX0_9CYAN|nr:MULTISPECIES: 16S rRNA (uracil(1498)-N(3))-methyltransferase [unclassified Trichocoleus]MBD1907046.1 16S rRNA (uracil(1498)-N(3))-methyltransferase [Trichocoleus sp. FACHB-832]MBD2063549.1 16S rRNA (uracil(1498)-N(3))-methyltransferase [Trichocoleus sp. FACHB-6]